MGALPPFKERFDMLLAEALLRHGMLGRIAPYSSMLSPDPSKYAALKIRGDIDEWRGTAPSLAHARCPKCRDHLIVTDVRETTDYVFGGTDCDMDPFTHATGTLRCKRDVNHLGSMPYGVTEVSLNGTIADLVHHIGDIADELGW